MLVHTEAIVLSTRRYRESSQLVTLYTEACGKCSVVAPQARRSIKRFGGALQPMRCSWVALYKKPNRTLHTLAKAEPVLPFRQILASYDRMSVGFAIVEAVYRTQPAEEPNPSLYQTLKQGLYYLNEMSQNFFALYCWMMLQIGRLSGFAIELFTDLTAGQPIEILGSSVLFSIDRGCPLRPSSIPTSVVVRLEQPALSFLQQVAQLSCEQLERVTPLQQVAYRQQILRLFDRFYRYHFGTPVISDVTQAMLNGGMAESVRWQ